LSEKTTQEETKWKKPIELGARLFGVDGDERPKYIEFGMKTTGGEVMTSTILCTPHIYWLIKKHGVDDACIMIEEGLKRLWNIKEDLPSCFREELLRYMTLIKGNESHQMTTLCKYISFFRCLKFGNEGDKYYATICTPHLVRFMLDHGLEGTHDLILMGLKKFWKVKDVSWCKEGLLEDLKKIKLDLLSYFFGLEESRK